MKWISKEQVLSLHSELIADLGGLDGIRDGRMLDPALNAPFQTFEGVDLYPGVIEKAARLGSGLVKKTSICGWKCNTETLAESGVTAANCFVYKIE